ncbi:MAG: SpoIID/LytB domain-containing protein [Acetivibrio ethanolgignens]
MKKKIILLFVGLAVLGTLIGVNLFSDRQPKGARGEEYIGEQEKRISRAEAAKMVSLLKFTEEELSEMERVITYTDTDPEKWYDKYINGMYEAGLVGEENLENNQYRPMSYMTVAECNDLVSRIAIQEQERNTDDSGLQELLTAMENLAKSQGKDAFLPREEWITLYEILWNKVYKSGLEEKTLYIVDSWESDEKLEKWQTVTDQGIFMGDGQDFLKYSDKKLRVYVCGTQIACILEVLKEDTLIPNVWIMKQAEESLTVFLNGCQKEFSLSGALKEQITEKVGDITVQDGVISKVSVKPDAINGRVLVTGKEHIELEKYGKKKLSSDFRIYCTYGDEVSMETARSILVGYQNTDFVIVGDEICAAIIKEPIKAENIRVALKTDGFEDYYHKTVIVTSTKPFTVTTGETKKTYKAGEQLKLTKKSKLFKEGRVEIMPEENGKLKVMTLKRNGEHPEYRGILEVALEKDEILLLNELPLEEYLYAVIPSEMPTSYGVEALKVQAICARSYAYRQLLSNGCGSYGAHVDDSALYQVYNNIPENKTSIQAVKETKGQVLKYNGELITAYYFSTSCGSTANANEVWNSRDKVPYLVGSLQSRGELEPLDLTEEKEFKKFISKDPVDTFDNESPWYRWQVKIPAESLKKTIDAGLKKRYEANPSLILTKQGDGSYKSVPVDTVGTVKKISVSKRCTGGIVTELVIKGSKNTIKVLTEYNIRTLLAPLYSTVIRQDNSKVESLSMLPSAFFYLEEQKEGKKVTGYRFVGGGYGHGVGMSQNGAKAMLDAGYSCEEVLKHYYNGVTIDNAVPE